MSSGSKMKQVRRALEKEGFTAVRTRGGHWRISHPMMIGPVFAPSTPSDHRALKNLKALMRRQMRPANDN